MFTSHMVKKLLYGFTALILCLFLCLLLLGVIFLRYLATPSGSSWAISKAQNILARDFATEIKFSHAKINLLSELSIDDLDIESHYKENKISVQIPKIMCLYRIEFIKRKFILTQCLIDHPRLNLDVRVTGENSKVEMSKSQESGMSLADLITHPPAEVLVEDFELRSMNLDFVSHQDDKQVKSQIRDLSLRSKFSLQENELMSSGELDARAKNTLHFANMDQAISMQWSGGVVWQVSIDCETKICKYQFNKFKSDFDFNNIDLTSNSQPRHIDIKSAKLDLDTKQLNQAQTPSSSPNSKENIQMSIGVSLSGVDFREQFFRPLDFEMKASSTAAIDLKNIEIRSDLSIQKVLVMTDQLVLHRVDQDNWTSNLDFKLIADSRFAKFLKSAAPLAKTGNFELLGQVTTKIVIKKKASLELKAEIPKILSSLSSHPFRLNIDSLSDVDLINHGGSLRADLNLSNLDFGDWKINTKSKFLLGDSKEIDGETEIAEIKAPEYLLARLLKPMKLTHQIKSDVNTLEANLKAELPLIEANAFGLLHESKLDVELKGDHMATDKNLSFNLKIDQGKVELKKKLPADLPIVQMSMQAIGRLRRQQFFNLDQFRFSLNKDLVQMTGDGSGDIKSKDLQFKINSILGFYKDFPEVKGTRFAGELSMPLNIALRRGEDLSVDGSLHFKDFGAMKGELGIESMTGQVPFSEHFRKEKNQLKFTELVTQNAFERVNFERLRPLLESDNQISIQKIHWQERVFGPLVGFVSLQQNMFFLHEFSLDLGIGGSLYGEMFFDAYPKNLQFGMLSRMTAIDLGQVLPKKFLRKIPEGDKTISARTGFVFSINKAVLDGRVDVTEIGSAQLITMINLLDPQFQDDKMNKLRSLLEIGYPTAVAMNFNQGYLDLGVSMNVLGISQDESIRSIPLSGFLIKPTAEIVSASQKGPLK